MPHFLIRKRTQSGLFPFRAHHDDPSLWLYESYGGWQSCFHLVHRTHRNAVEVRRELLSPVCMYLCGNPQSADGFAQKGRFLVLTFGESHSYLGAAKSIGNAGKAGA
jgi:hypothetical protein